MSPTPALPFIPQRPPFVLVDNILSCDESIVITDFHIPEDHILVENGLLSEAGLMENVAQTCAARIGWLNQTQPVRLGVIGSINNFEILQLPRAGKQLVTTVAVESSVFEAIIVNAEVTCDDQPAARCKMKVFVIEN